MHFLSQNHNTHNTMAFSTSSCLFFLFLILVLFSTQISARDSYSFRKFQRETPYTDENPAFIPQSENGYGLYGHETTYNNNEELNNNNNEANANYDDSFSTPSLSETAQTQESNKNYRDTYPQTTEIYDNNKDTSYYENSDTYGKDKREKEAYKGYRNKDRSYHETDKREKNAYKGYSNNVERQGMSDTRYMAIGNYYYDLEDDINHGRFYQNHYYNYQPTGYNEKKSNFKNPYYSNQQSEMVGEEQGDQFTP